MQKAELAKCGANREVYCDDYDTMRKGQDAERLKWEAAERRARDEECRRAGRCR